MPDRGVGHQTEVLGGLQIDHKFEPRRLLDREIGRFGALEDLIHETPLRCDLPIFRHSPGASSPLELTSFNSAAMVMRRRWWIDRHCLQVGQLCWFNWLAMLPPGQPAEACKSVDVYSREPTSKLAPTAGSTDNTPAVHSELEGVP